MSKKEKALLSFVVFFISFSALSIEIIYARIFSVLTYYHFSSMIISIALLGFGAAGSYISIKYNKKEDTHKFISRNMLYFLLSNILTFYFIVKLRFYPIMLSGDWTNNLSLLFYYIALAVPFFFAGKILIFIFTRHSKDIGFLYFIDLVGGGAGSLSVFFFINYFSAPVIIHVVSILLAVITLLYLLFTDRKKVLIPLLILLPLFIITKDIHVNKKMLVYPPPSKEGFNWSSPWKGKDKVVYSRWNIIERLDITRPFKRKAFHFGGDISNRFKNDDMELRYMFKDGIISTGILKVDQPISEYGFLEGYLQAAPYKFRRYKSVVSIGFGGGIDLWIAAFHKVQKIIGVEINPLKISVLKKEFRAYSGNLANRALLVPKEGRHFLSRFKPKVDVIQMSGIDSYPALSSGAFAMSENYLLTKEAMISMLQHLNADGVVSINRILFDPPRETLRMVSTMLAALDELKVNDIAKHFIVLKGQRWANILLKRNPFKPEEISKLAEWVQDMRFSFLYRPDTTNHNNTFVKLIRMERSQRQDFFDTYPYKISPATDNAPFFFQYYKWGNLFSENFKARTYEKLMPIGLKIIIFSILQISLLGFLFIIIPMRKKKISLIPGVTLNTLFYFASIGLAFILIEIIIIQKFIVFLGGPLYSLSVMLFTILVFSGLGSFVSKALTSKSAKIVFYIFGGIVVLSLFYLLILSSILQAAMHTSTFTRIIISILLLAPLSFLMGMPFPTGVRLLSDRFDNLIPWGWAVNSVFTVFGSVFCLFLSISFGYSFSWLVALLFYLAALSAYTRMRKNIEAQ